jgi:hypothetical protein
MSKEKSYVIALLLSLLLCLSFQVGVSEANYNAGLVYIIVYAYFYLFKLSHYF